MCKHSAYNPGMIRTFRNKGLADLWSKGSTARIDRRFQRRILIRLDVLEQASRPEDLNLPGFDYHALKGFRPARFTVHVNGPWCITFEFTDGDAFGVDFEQYH
jgi:proteic killer suppression protein